MGYGAWSPTPASTELVPKLEQYTQFTIVNSAALLLELRLASFHGILQSWGDLLLCCELWGLAGFPTDIGTVRVHYFSYTMCSGSVKPLWWSSFLSQTLLGKTAKHRGVEKVLSHMVLSTIIWAQHHHFFQHPCFLRYFLSITGIYNIFTQEQQPGGYHVIWSSGHT